VLWPGESGWRLVAEFAHIRDFTAQQMVTVKGLGATPTNRPLTLNLRLATNGVVLQTVELRGSTRLWPYVRGHLVPNYELNLTYTANRDRQWVDLVQVVDQGGRAIRFGHAEHPWRGMSKAALEIPRDCQSIDLTFAVHRGEVAEFHVRPIWNTQAFLVPK
jgi:hypothetical protein